MWGNIVQDLGEKFIQNCWGCVSWLRAVFPCGYICSRFSHLARCGTVTQEMHNIYFIKPYLPNIGKIQDKIFVRSCQIYNPVQNGWDAHPKLATISDLFLVFNETALNPVHFPLPLFNVEYARFSSRFCGRDNIEMGGGGKENKDVQEWKTKLKFIDIVSQLFLHGIVDRILLLGLLKILKSST